MERIPRGESPGEVEKEKYLKQVETHDAAFVQSILTIPSQRLQETIQTRAAAIGKDPETFVSDSYYALSPVERRHLVSAHMAYLSEDTDKDTVAQTLIDRLFPTH